ncbi:MAG: HEAT repeat domain-containing protein [Polyangiaceae bacterium]
MRHPEGLARAARALDPTAEHAAAGAAIVAALASREGAAAREDLVSFGERALRSADARARLRDREALAASGARRSPTIRSRSPTRDADVRLSAVRALGALGAAGPLRALVRESSDEETVSVALRALSAADLATALEVARELVRGSDAALASTAVEVLSRPPGAERARGLLLALEHADKDVVALALAELGPDIAGAGEEVFARVADCLTHPAWEVRRLASELLGQGRSPEARALLRARLEHELEPAVREVLQGALSIRPPRGPADGDSQSGDDGSDEEPRG